MTKLWLNVNFSFSIRSMKINIISESAFTVQGHGVHTAFEENYNCLKVRGDNDVATNTSRPADVTHIHTIGPYSLRHLLFDKGKKVVSAHVTPDSFVGSLIGAKYWLPLAKLYLRWFYNRADGVCAVSSEVVDELKRMGVTTSIFLVPNTIDTDKFKLPAGFDKAALRRQLGIAEDAFVVICSGQVQPRKRVDTFVECAKKLPQHQFVWVGGMPFKGMSADRAEMEQYMNMKLPNLRFTGVIEREKVVDYNKAADLFFLPSIQETFGIVIVEAAATGLPVLLRDIEQYKVTFKDWYAKGNEADFVAIIEKFATDKDFYKHYQQLATKIASEYDSKRGAETLLSVYREVLLKRAAALATPF